MADPILKSLEPYITGDLATMSGEAERTNALERANAEAEGYLRAAGYTVPVVEATPDIRGRIADIARYHLAHTLQILPEPADTSSLHTNYKAALAWFRDVGAGRVTLDIARVDSTATPGGVEVVTRAKRGWGGGL